MNGVDLMTVKELLGHKDIKMTMRYSHLSPDHKRVAVKRIETVLRRETKVIELPPNLMFCGKSWTPIWTPR